MKERFTSSAQYGDIKGNVTIDGFTSHNLNEFAREYGVNTSKYFVVGIDIHRGNNHESVYIIAVEQNQFGDGTDYENILDYLQHNNEAFVKKIELEKATMEDYLKKCKRFNLVASSVPELLNTEIAILR